MMLFRSAREDDLLAIHDLAENSGIGMTTLTKDIELLSNRLRWSTASFSKSIRSPSKEYYLFVLEDPTNKKIVGTSAIESLTGHSSPFFSYKVSRHLQVCDSLNIRNEYEILTPVNDNEGRSELCTLFLDQAYRQNSNGRLLSRARFLFIAQYRDRFSPIIIAEMRGVSDDGGRSPFWDHVGSHFFQMSFAEADRLTLLTNKQFITELMPKHPIYVKLLPPAAQEVLGKPHQSTVPALKILLREGFYYHNYIDIFDAGPTIEAHQDRIHTVATSKVMAIDHILDHVDGKRFILTNTKLDFRATLTELMVSEQHDGCTLSHQAAELLQVKRGDFIRIAPL